VLVILVWGFGFYAFFKVKKIVNNKNPKRHDEIFGAHWSDHSMHTTWNYLKLVFLPSSWSEFKSREFITWIIACYICDVLAVCIVFYPIIRIFFDF